MSEANDSSNQNTPNARRDFMKTGGIGLLGAMIAGRIIGRGTPAQAADAKKAEEVKPSDPMAQSLGYVEDAKKVDVKKYPKRAGAAGEKQFCYNCQFYGEKTKPKESKAAPCTIFAQKLVKSHAWCNSWTQNAAVKD